MKDGSVGCFVIIIFAVPIFFTILGISYEHKEIDLDEYKNVKEWLDETPEIREKFNFVMGDNKIKRCEYNNLFGEHKSALHNRSKNAILTPTTQLSLEK